MRARARASGVSHASGRYNCAPSSHACVPVQSAAVVATWQFAILPSAPQYWRATPTECVALLRKARAVEDQHAFARGHDPSQQPPEADRPPTAPTVMKC